MFQIKITVFKFNKTIKYTKNNNILHFFARTFLIFRKFRNFTDCRKRIKTITWKVQKLNTLKRYSNLKIIVTINNTNKNNQVDQRLVPSYSFSFVFTFIEKDNLVTMVSSGFSRNSIDLLISVFLCQFSKYRSTHRYLCG